VFDASSASGRPPFRLGPDPSFYFESSGHGKALAYLKYGVYQREGFIVVTGEIGSGKTTLVRKLLESLDPREVTAAQVVSTQLDSYELLRAVCTAFGVPVPGSSKALTLATLEAFFAALAANGRRALLIVDEAQNLGLRETEELRMLSNFQLGGQGLVQSFLVGQPELRLTLRSSSMEQLRQRVIASCHLAAMTAPETKGVCRAQVAPRRLAGRSVHRQRGVREVARALRRNSAPHQPALHPRVPGVFVAGRSRDHGRGCGAGSRGAHQRARVWAKRVKSTASW
jgi:type II secretory pathway predicted ATPase ExeA